MVMKNDARIKRPAAAGLALGDASLWPSAEYDRQLDRLRDAVGQPVYSVEVTGSEIQMTVPLGNWPAVLLSVIDLLAADPVKRLYPHMVVLDDGRGLNLGWIARISRQQPFDPAPAQILYQERRLLQQLLYHARQLSDETVALTSRRNLAAMLGRSSQRLVDES